MADTVTIASGSEVESQEPKTCNRKAFFCQVGGAVVASINYLSIGLVRGWASPAMPSLDSNESEYRLPQAPLNIHTKSWIVSLPALGSMCASCFLSYLTLSYLGRKMSLLLSNASFLASFLLLGLSFFNSSVPLVMAGRILGGVGIGLSTAATVIYIAECSQPNLRGALASLPSLFLAFGNLLCYIVGAYLPWHMLAFFCSSLPALGFVSLILLPESSAWLIANGRRDAAITSYQWYRRVTKDTAREELEKCSPLSKPDPTHINLIHSFFSRETLLPLLLSMALMFFQMWSGVYVLVFKTVDIFAAANSSIDSHLATIIVGIVQFVAVGMSVFLVDHVGRRPLLLVSGSLLSFSMLMLGSCFCWPSSHKWLPLAAIILAFLGYATGYASIPFIMIGELLPKRTKNVSGAISSTFNLLNLFLVLRFFSILENQMEYYGVFWLYSGVSFVGVIFVALFLPETKGKSLNQIEQLFSQQHKKEEDLL